MRIKEFVSNRAKAEQTKVVERIPHNLLSNDSPGLPSPAAVWCFLLDHARPQDEPAATP